MIKIFIDLLGTVLNKMFVRIKNLQKCYFDNIYWYVKVNQSATESTSNLSIKFSSWWEIIFLFSRVHFFQFILHVFQQFYTSNLEFKYLPPDINHFVFNTNSEVQEVGSTRNSFLLAMMQSKIEPVLYWKVVPLYTMYNLYLDFLKLRVFLKLGIVTIFSSNLCRYFHFLRKPALYSNIIIFYFPINGITLFSQMWQVVMQTKNNC